MAYIPQGGDRSGNQTIPTPPGERATKGVLDSHQNDMKARNARIADVARPHAGGNPGRPVPAETSLPRPFKVSLPG